MAYEHCLLMLHNLVKERQRICRRGRLTDAEDRRLDEIDEEISHWKEVRENLFIVGQEFF